MKKTPAPLTPEQMAAARAGVAAEHAREDITLSEQMDYELKRDELAYVLIQQAHAEKRRLSWGEAQAAAAETLKPKTTTKATTTTNE